MNKIYITIIFSLILFINLYSQYCIQHISPSNDDTIYTPTPTLIWSRGTCPCNINGCSGPGCQSYWSYTIILRVSTDSLFTQIVHSWNYNTPSELNSHTIPGNILQTNTTYWWKLSWSHQISCCCWACSGGGSCGPFYSSYPTKFKTRLHPLAPSNLSANAVSSSRIDLVWYQNTLVNETGFKIERSDDLGRYWFIRDSTGENVIYYIDTGLISNKIYFYRVSAYNVYGNSAYSNLAYDTTFPPIGIININSEIPNEYKLYINYPNPFNPVTNIKFSIPHEGYVTLKVYDLTGAAVQTYIDGNMKAGTYNAEIDGSNLASGVYFYTLSSLEYTETKKMVLIK